MKNTLTILFSAFYLLANSGLMLNLHYCGEQLLSVDVFDSVADCCCVEAEEPTDCCSDDQVYIQLPTVQPYTAKAQFEFEAVEDLQESSIHELPEIAQTDQLSAPVQHEYPPAEGRQPLYIRHCSLKLLS